MPFILKVITNSQAGSKLRRLAGQVAADSCVFQAITSNGKTRSRLQL